MGPPFRNSVLLLCTGLFAATSLVFAIFEVPIILAQKAPKKWDPRRYPAGTEFIGDQACGECHKKSFAPFARTGMAQAMEPITESKVLTENPKLTLNLGPYSYEIKRQGKQSFYSVTDGTNTISSPIDHAFGQGRMGQTYLLQRDGNFYESRVSFYNETKGLDFTTGSPRTVPPSLDEAFGHLLSNSEVVSCFSC